MEIVQKTHMILEKGGKKVEIMVDPDFPLGTLFDVFMECKGFCVDRMVKAHKEESEEAEKQMPSTEKQN